jgi:hypothetical protein
VSTAESRVGLNSTTSPWRSNAALTRPGPLAITTPVSPL